MRLIDADKVLEDMDRTLEESGLCYHEKEFRECVEYASTAYDVDKVVKQLEKKQEETGGIHQSWNLTML